MGLAGKKKREMKGTVFLHLCITQAYLVEVPLIALLQRGTCRTANAFQRYILHCLYSSTTFILGIKVGAGLRQ